MRAYDVDIAFGASRASCISAITSQKMSCPWYAKTIAVSAPDQRAGLAMSVEVDFEVRASSGRGGSSLEFLNLHLYLD